MDGGNAEKSGRGGGVNECGEEGTVRCKRANSCNLTLTSIVRN